MLDFDIFVAVVISVNELKWLWGIFNIWFGYVVKRIEWRWLFFDYLQRFFEFHCYSCLKSAAFRGAALFRGRRSLEGGALNLFWVLGAALFRGQRSLEGGAKKRKYGTLYTSLYQIVIESTTSYLLFDVFFDFLCLQCIGKSLLNLYLHLFACDCYLS